MLYLANAFSLQMVNTIIKHGTKTVITMEEIDAKEVVGLIKNNSTTFAVGHKDTANVLGEILGLKEDLFNRISISISPKDDILIVAQLMGGRLPEGSTTLPEGFTFKFYKIEIK